MDDERNAETGQGAAHDNHHRTRILGDTERGLTVDEIAQILHLQPGTVKIYLRDNKRRIDLYQRLFEQDDGIKERAFRILEARRGSSGLRATSPMTEAVIDMEDDKAADSKKGPQSAYEKLEDVSPEVFDAVLFAGRESPGGWRCTRDPSRPSQAERELWHKIVVRALSTDNYERAVLLADEYDEDVLNNLFEFALTQDRRGCYGFRNIVLQTLSANDGCLVVVDPKCIAIYA